MPAYSRLVSYTANPPPIPLPQVVNLDGTDLNDNAVAFPPPLAHTSLNPTSRSRFRYSPYFISSNDHGGGGEEEAYDSALSVRNDATSARPATYVPPSNPISRAPSTIPITPTPFHPTAAPSHPTPLLNTPTPSRAGTVQPPSVQSHQIRRTRSQRHVSIQSPSSSTRTIIQPSNFTRMSDIATARLLSLSPASLKEMKDATMNLAVTRNVDMGKTLTQQDDAGKKALEEVFQEMRMRFPILQACENNWVLHRFAQRALQQGSSNVRKKTVRRSALVAEQVLGNLQMLNASNQRLTRSRSHAMLLS